MRNITATLKYLNAYTGKLVAALVRLYQLTLSPDHGLLLRSRYPFGFCPFYPTCSEYSRQVLIRHGLIKGSALAVWRILRCNPSSRPQFHFR